MADVAVVAKKTDAASRNGQAVVRIVIADDHPLVLAGLEALLAGHPEFAVVERCATGAATIAAAERHQPDIMIVDLHMPDMDGLAVARELRGRVPGTRIVLLADRIHEDELIESLRLGVKGVVLKDMPPKLLVQCLQRVQAGGQWLEKESAGRAMEKLVRREGRARELATLLTPREMEVVRLAAASRTNKEIAGALFIAEGTVKIHLHNVFEKTQVGRRAELVRFAQEYGLI